MLLASVGHGQFFENNDWAIRQMYEREAKESSLSTGERQTCYPWCGKGIRGMNVGSALCFFMQCRKNAPDCMAEGERLVDAMMGIGSGAAAVTLSTRSLDDAGEPESSTKTPAKRHRRS